MNLDIEKIISGIAIGATPLVLEEIKNWIKNRNDTKKPKKRKSRKKNS
ncbi:Uncharacterised protein [uncultured archaeon]|nr:Uncharacterised protein [uncultured archaeon]